jgi:alkanesulfonate monooxygenase SsuD/methylene tetrahydromethanopterin reductase-like flavin-dependent oxidoreductase (luciferase family)
MTLDFGLGLPIAGPPKGGPVSKWLDDLDAVLPKLAGHFKSLWITDHFQWLDDPTYEAWTALSFLAARFPPFDVGPMVLGQSYRNPALLAKMAATLQCLSGGRFIMGIGAGWKEDEYHAYNFPYPPVGVRMEQLIDTLEILKRLWREPGKVTFHGKHYHVVDAYCEPKPDPVPPIMIGGGGERTMRIAARYADWWNLSDAGLAKYTDRLSVLKAQCERVGRDLSTLRLTWFGRLSVGKTEAEAVERGRLGFSSHDEAFPHGKGIYTRENALVGTVSQIVEQMQQLKALGIDYFMIEVLDLNKPGILETVVEEILPKVR